MDELEEIRQCKLEKLMAELRARDQKPAASPSTAERIQRSWPSEPVPINERDFNTFLELYPQVVVDCWAPWCGPCRQLAPAIEILAKKYAGKVAFGKLNTDDNQQLALRFEVMSIPTLLFFKAGVLVDRITGFVPGNRIERQIVQHFGSEVA